MCNCSSRANTSTYTVIYPDGRRETKQTLVAAKIAAGRIPGARYERVAAQTTP